MKYSIGQAQAMESRDESYSWLVDAYLSVFDHTKNTLFSSFHLPAKHRISVFWSYNCYVRPPDSSIVALSWDFSILKRKTS